MKKFAISHSKKKEGKINPTTRTGLTQSWFVHRSGRPQKVDHFFSGTAPNNHLEHIHLFMTQTSVFQMLIKMANHKSACSMTVRNENNPTQFWVNPLRTCNVKLYSNCLCHPWVMDEDEFYEICSERVGISHYDDWYCPFFCLPVLACGFTGKFKRTCKSSLWFPLQMTFAADDERGRSALHMVTPTL